MFMPYRRWGHSQQNLWLCLDANAVVGDDVCFDIDGYLSTIAFDE